MSKIRAVSAAITVAALGVVLVATSSIATASATYHGTAHEQAVAQYDRDHHRPPRHHPTRTSTPKPTPTTTTTDPTTPTPTPAPARTPGTKTVEITFYGAYDNDPPGSRDIAHPVLHQTAGGTGTSQDPMTFASPSGAGAYPWGQRIYVPSVQKYFIREDSCGVSWTAPSGCGAVTHVDLYVGNPSNDKAVVDCENALTPDNGGQIILNPPATLKYDPTPMWKQSTRSCMKLH